MSLLLNTCRELVKTWSEAATAGCTRCVQAADSRLHTLLLNTCSSAAKQQSSSKAPVCEALLAKPASQQAESSSSHTGA